MKVSKTTIAKEMKKSPNKNPSLGFVGSPYKNEPGIFQTIYPEALVSTAKKYRPESEDITGASVKTIEKELRKHKISFAEFNEKSNLIIDSNKTQISQEKKERIKARITGKICEQDKFNKKNTKINPTHGLRPVFKEQKYINAKRL